MPGCATQRASNSRNKEDFFTMESGRKLNQHDDRPQRRKTVPDGAALDSEAKQPNDFFMERLNGYPVSNDSRGSTSARSYKKASLQDSL